MGKKEEPFNLQETKKQVKAKQKEKEMNTIKRINWNTLLTVFTTLLIVALLAGWTFFVWNLSAENQKSINLQVQSAVEAVASKENQ